MDELFDILVEERREMSWKRQHAYEKGLRVLFKEVADEAGDTAPTRLFGGARRSRRSKQELDASPLAPCHLKFPLNVLRQW